MGVVYRAFDTQLHRTVAIKVVGRAEDGRLPVDLLREARMASGLNHPNICTIYQVGEAAGHPYIAMELVEGAALSTKISPGQGLDLVSTIRYGVQIADALAHAHERGVIHRDLKGANIIVTPQGQAKVLDFGLATNVATAAGSDADTSTLTDLNDGLVAGTLLYMAPELLRGEPADARSDLWALGVVLYEMASGERPFECRTRAEVVAAILERPMPPLPPRVPQGLRRIISRCLQKDPANRYNSAAEVRAALDTISNRPDRWWHALGSRRVVVIGAALTALVLAIGILWLPGLWGPATVREMRLAVIATATGDSSREVELLTDGIPDSLIGSLSRLQLPHLSIIAPQSVAHYRKPPIASDLLGVMRSGLDISHLVTVGIRLQGEVLSINWSLDNAEDKRNIWKSDWFRRSKDEDVLTIEEEIATKIAELLSPQLTGQSALSASARLALSKRDTNSYDAHKFYLEGLYGEGLSSWYKASPGIEGYLRSLDLYTRAIKEDPEYIKGAPRHRRHLCFTGLRRVDGTRRRAAKGTNRARARGGH